uniref:Uncharacterized protein n=1 Tax=Oryza nivara TaxID=4536 RepID=A0A0E0IB35_ORYNI
MESSSIRLKRIACWLHAIQRPLREGSLKRGKAARQCDRGHPKEWMQTNRELDIKGDGSGGEFHKEEGHQWEIMGMGTRLEAWRAKGRSRRGHACIDAFSKESDIHGCHHRRIEHRADGCRFGWGD